MKHFLRDFASGCINLAIAFLIACVFGENNLQLGLLGFINLIILSFLVHYAISLEYNE